MRASTIISRYLLKELIPPFVICLFFLTFVFLMTRIPEITNMVVNYNTGIVSVFLLILYSLPRFMEFTIPMSVMIATLLTFIRMSGDNEVLALKGGGVSIYRLLPPVVVFSLFCTILTLWITLWGVPWGKLSLKHKAIEIAQSNLNIALKERRFNNSFKDVMIYVASVDMKTKQLKDIFLEDSRTKGSVVIAVAPKGALISDPGAMVYTLRLYGGTVNQVDLETGMVNTIQFDRYDINLAIGGKVLNPKTVTKDLDEMSLKELVGFIKQGSKEKSVISAARMGFHEKFSIPVACLVLGVLALALGLQSASSKRSSGLGLGLFFILLYYLLLAAGWSGGKSGSYAPVLGMWLPDVVMGGIAVYLLVRIANERPVEMPRVIKEYLSAIQHIFLKESPSSHVDSK